MRVDSIINGEEKTRMEWQKPSPQQVWQAIESTWQHATRALRVDNREIAPRNRCAAPTMGIFSTPRFLEKRDASQESAAEFARLAWATISPDMKLVIEPTPDRAVTCFAPDTHDKQSAPRPISKDMNVHQLMEEQPELAESIEAAWDVSGLPPQSASCARIWHAALHIQ